MALDQSFIPSYTTAIRLTPDTTSVTGVFQRQENASTSVTITNTSSTVFVYIRIFNSRRTATATATVNDYLILPNEKRVLSKHPDDDSIAVLGSALAASNSLHVIAGSGY